MLTPILKEVYDEIFEKEETSHLMGIGVIKLIFKKRGDKNDLKNYSYNYKNYNFTKHY